LLQLSGRLFRRREEIPEIPPTVMLRGAKKLRIERFQDETGDIVLEGSIRGRRTISSSVKSASLRFAATRSRSDRAAIPANWSPDFCSLALANSSRDLRKSNRSIMEAPGAVYGRAEPPFYRKAAHDVLQFVGSEFRKLFLSMTQIRCSALLLIWMECSLTPHRRLLVCGENGRLSTISTRKKLGEGTWASQPTTCGKVSADADHDAENRDRGASRDGRLARRLSASRCPKLLASLPPGRWTIVTSSTRPLAEVRLRAAGLTIPGALVTSSDVRMASRIPNPTSRALLWDSPGGVRCRRDVPAGIRAGKAAGARVIALPDNLGAIRASGRQVPIGLDGCADISMAELRFALTLNLINPYMQNEPPDGVTEAFIPWRRSMLTQGGFLRFGWRIALAATWDPNLCDAPALCS